MERGTSVAGLPLKISSASNEWGRSPARLLRSAAVQLEGLGLVLPVYSDLRASVAHIFTSVEWACVVVPFGGARVI